MVVTRRVAGPSREPTISRRTATTVSAPSPRAREAQLLLAASLVLLLGTAVLDRRFAPSLNEVAAGLASGALVDLNQIDDATPLVALLSDWSQPQERGLIGATIIARRDQLGGLPNVGELAKIELAAAALEGVAAPGLEQRLGEQPSAESRVALLTASELRSLKPHLVVRTPAQFRAQLWLWATAIVAGFALVHLALRMRRFPGDPFLLPLVEVLVGLGYLTMVSVRDPVRDLLLLHAHAQGVLAGCAVLLLAAFVPLESRWVRRAGAAALALAVLLSVMLLFLGTGPGSSDAKVNLFGFQPVEAIKLLVVFFLAAYFFERWEFLREVQDARPELERVRRFVTVPKLEYLLPPIVAMGLVLVFFFLQRDMGPALVLAFLFLILYAVARGRVLMAAFGLAILLVGFFVGYQLGVPATVKGRIDMWLHPWDNHFRGGDHLAHSLWSFASGGVGGAGLGAGRSEFVPEVHTDLVLASVGEELGLVGVLVVLALYVLLIGRSLRIATSAAGLFSFFLAFGLTLMTALQVLLISGGVLGALPLSGVVSPFLSYGRSAMLANFLVVGLLLAVSAQEVGHRRIAELRPGVRWCAWGLGLVAAILGVFAVQVQWVTADRTVIRGVLAMQGDGVRRFRYNPRLVELVRALPRGAIVDRNGLPLATGDRAELERHRAVLEDLGLDPDPPADASRYYPLGGRGFLLLGDWPSQVAFSASNTSYLERDTRTTLQGFDDRSNWVQPSPDEPAVLHADYTELVPLLRASRAARERFVERDRTVRATIDLRLQARSADALAVRVAEAGLERGALVVLDAASGELLAAASVPWPQSDPAQAPDAALLDRARYGLYPPGSTFKLVTAMAALRKDPQLLGTEYQCRRLEDGRVGEKVRGWGRPIRDDPRVSVPHGRVDLERGIAVSCNAYFAQLAAYDVGAARLLETAARFGIDVASPNTAETLADSLAQAGYGQGQVVATPLEMAQVAAVIASGGREVKPFWIESDRPQGLPELLLEPHQALQLGAAMREVVTSGSASRSLGAVSPAIAGKTGTAEVAGQASHAWFVGFAPYRGSGRRIAIAVIVENGGYGGVLAARVAGDVVRSAAALGIL